MRLVSCAAMAIGGVAVIAPEHVEAQTTALKISPSIKSRYDSNPLRLNDQRSSGPLDDIRVTPGIAFSYTDKFGTDPIFLRGEIGYDKHSRFDFLDRARVLIRGGGSFLFGPRCQFSPAATLNIEQTDITELSGPVGNTTTTQEYEAAVACNEVAGIVPRFAASHLERTNSSSGLRRTNRTLDQFTASLGYTRPSLGRIDVLASYNRTLRPELRAVTGADRVTETRRYGVEVSRSVANLVQARGSISHLRVEAGTFTPGFRGTAWLGEVRLAPVPRFTVTARTSRDAGGSDGFGTAFTVRKEFTVSSQLTFGSRARLSLETTQLNRRFRGEDPVVFVIPRIAERVTSGTVRFGYDLTTRFRLNLDVSRRERVTRNNFYNYSSTSVGLSLGGNF